MEASIELLRLQCKDWGIELETWQLDLLRDYAVLLADYRLANVIGTKDKEKIILEHLLDALSCLTAKGLPWEGSLVDVGTGAGLPGIPIAIACTRSNVTLLEATGKKVSFLESSQRTLGLANTEVLQARAEEVGEKLAFRENFDLAVSRALAPLPILLEYCAPLVCTGGSILAMKGQLQEDELSKGEAAARLLGAKLRGVRKVAYGAQLPQKERRLVVLDKVDPTPSTFPRRVGLAKKRPLGE